MADRRRKAKRSAGLGYFIILLLILIIFAAAGVFVSKRFAPSKERANLNSYYNLTAYESANRQEARADELAIIINDKILDNEDNECFRAVKADGGTYVGISVIQKEIDGRFYLDENENKVIVTNAVNYIIIPVDSTVYTENGEAKDSGYVIAKSINDKVYMNMDFVAEHSSASYRTFSNPNRIYIEDEWGSVDLCNASQDVKLRSKANQKSTIIADISKNAQLKVISSADDWIKVIDENGYIGFVQTKNVGDIETVPVVSDYVEPEYTHVLMDGNINMAWHGIYYYESNQYVEEYTRDMKGVNVLAPTWFLFGDYDGNIISYASQDYVDYAHSKGIKVWAVLEDLDGLAGADVVPYTSSRQNAIAQMVDTCLAYGIDGINVDLETITTDSGKHFVQFLRELSVECRRNNLVLSICDYAPYSYNAFRRTDLQSRIADYVCVMAYDDYVGGNEAGPNAGLPFITEVMGLCENTVDMSRLIVGIPFYTRVWYERDDGTLGKETLDMGAVTDLEWQYGLTFEWQEEVGYDYATYKDWNSTARIWWENAKSIDAKLKLISQYNVAGVAAWRLGQETSDVWEVIAKYY